MVCTKRDKYVYYELGGTEELYDLADGPEELRNIRADSGELTREMRGALLDWVHQNGDRQMLDGGELVLSPRGQQYADRDAAQTSGLALVLRAQADAPDS